MQTSVWCENLKQIYPYMKCLQMKDYHLVGEGFSGVRIGFFQLLLQMLTRSCFYFISFNFCFFFSRWRFTFYLSIFFYGIRFLWTVSWSVILSLLFCVVCSWVTAVLLKYWGLDYLCLYLA